MPWAYWMGNSRSKRKKKPNKPKKNEEKSFFLTQLCVRYFFFWFYRIEFNLHNQKFIHNFVVKGVLCSGWAVWAPARFCTQIRLLKWIRVSRVHRHFDCLYNILIHIYWIGRFYLDWIAVDRCNCYLQSKLVSRLGVCVCVFLSFKLKWIWFH